MTIGERLVNVWVPCWILIFLAYINTKQFAPTSKYYIHLYKWNENEMFDEEKKKTGEEEKSHVK